MWKYLIEREVSQQVHNARVVTVHVDVDTAIAEQGEASASRILFMSLEGPDDLLLLLCRRRSTTPEPCSDDRGSQQSEDAGSETHRDDLELYAASNEVL
jgi:hypothetical protein